MKRFSAGFTLLELMVVIAVMGTIMALSAGSFVSSQVKSRDARRKSDLTQIGKALEFYLNDHRRYPPHSAGGEVAGCGSDNQSPCAWGDAFEDASGTIYMERIPGETKSGRQYVYQASSDGQAYQLFVRLENTNDPGADHNRDGTPDEYTVSCGNANCNFGISSPNVSPSDTLN